MEGMSEQEDSGPFEPIEIGDEYKTTAGTLSRQRGAEAGFRLARLLEHVLAD